MGNELVHLEGTLQVVRHEAGELGAALDAAEGASLPDTAGDELECCCEVLASVQNNDQGRGRAAHVWWRSPGRRRQRR